MSGFYGRLSNERALWAGINLCNPAGLHVELRKFEVLYFNMLHCSSVLGSWEIENFLWSRNCSRTNKARGITWAQRFLIAEIFFFKRKQHLLSGILSSWSCYSVSSFIFPFPCLVGLGAGGSGGRGSLIAPLLTQYTDGRILFHPIVLSITGMNCWDAKREIVSKRLLGGDRATHVDIQLCT